MNNDFDHRYDDLLDHPRFEPRRHPRMPMADRAPVLEAVRLFCENRGLMLLVASHDAAPGFGIARIEDLLGGGRPESADGEP